MNHRVYQRKLSRPGAAGDRPRREGLPEVRGGGQPRFELAAVLAWLRSRGGAGAQPHVPE